LAMRCFPPTSVEEAVTVQQHHLCFVIGQLRCNSHFAGLFLASVALLNSYLLWVPFKAGIKLDSDRRVVCGKKS